MATLRQAYPRPVVALLLAVVAVQVALTLQLGEGTTRPHDVELLIAAPPVVGQALAQRANALEGRPLDAGATQDAEQARERVRTGDLPAAVVVDLAAPGDVLYVSSVMDPRLVRALRVRIAALGSSYGRSLDVRRLEPPRNGDAGRAGPYALAAGWVVLGFLMAAGVSMARGPMAATRARALARAAGLASGAVALGLLCALAVGPLYDDSLLGVWLVGTLTMGAAACVMLAMESLAGLAGIGLATAAFLLLVTPLARLSDPDLLPSPWPLVTPLTPHGAALDAVTRVVHFGDLHARSLLVLAAWVVLPLLTMVLARRELEAGSRPVPA